MIYATLFMNRVVSPMFDVSCSWLLRQTKI